MISLGRSVRPRRKEVCAPARLPRSGVARAFFVSSVHRVKKRILLLTGLLYCLCARVSGQFTPVTGLVPADTLISILSGPYVALEGGVRVVSVKADGRGQICVRLSDNATQLPVTRRQVLAAEDRLRAWCGMPDARVSLVAAGADLGAQALEDSAWCGTVPQGSPVRRLDDGFGGPLSGRNIALWPSHGRYYEKKLGRWEWQRARLLTTVEDLYTPSYVLPFLIPMLEGAGADVFTPRERDTTSVCVVVDDSDPFPAYSVTVAPRSTVAGYARRDKLRAFDNPFGMGLAHVYDFGAADSAVFTGLAPASGLMMVYLAYARLPQAQGEVMVTVRHAGGEARFAVRQSMGGGMWVPLGWLPFAEGKEWAVVIKGRGPVSADAVRIGGGMGVVERDGGVSGLPSWAEAARYYLQADGFDKDKVLSLSQGKSDYTDDVNCRGEWVNSLVADKHIPIDLSFALHTDAGVSEGDSVIGTLALITTKKDGGRLPDGRPTLTSRQMAGLVTGSLISDIRRAWRPDWTWRGIADKGYSESRRPAVPSLLLELLSHQNVADMMCGLHPAFRQDVCRAIYKGILRYLAGPSAPVAPMPPSRVGLRFVGSDSVAVCWSATADTLEPTAVADRYFVYEGGREVCSTADTFAVVRQPLDGVVRNYRVVAVGPGGRSLPSESLSACLWNGGRRALLVEGMDRLAAPQMSTGPQVRGVLPWADAGAPWPADVYSVGEQFDFDPHSDWTDDDSPGCGASLANLEMVHARGAATLSNEPSDVAHALRMEGYSFVSVSKSFFDSDTLPGRDSTAYSLVRINLDRQRATPYGHAGLRHAIYTPGFRRHVEALKSSAAKIVLSGCFVGSDIASDDVKTWCANVLGFFFRAPRATSTFRLTAKPRWLRENAIPTPSTDGHAWRNADAIEPAAPQARTVCRYADTQMSAAVEMDNVIVIGY